MTIFALGFAMLCGFATIDTFIRIRMRHIGKKWVFLRGGTFDYGEYLKAGAEHGWSSWPVYLMWALLICGLVLILFSFFYYDLPRL